MSEKLNALSDEMLEGISGGTSTNLKAAYAVIRGDFGNGAERVTALRKAGYDPEAVQGLVNAVIKYENVAKDVISGKYGVGAERVAALNKAGFPADVVQNLVNNMLVK